MNIFDEIKASAKGAEILTEWLGAGGSPVPDWQAEARAGVCESCPFNRYPKWWESAKDAIANRIKDHLTVKHRLGFRLKNEDAMHMCAVCSCTLPLKVWCPIDHIKNHTHADTLAAFPKVCWIRAEIEGLK